MNLPFVMNNRARAVIECPDAGTTRTWKPALPRTPR